MERAKICMSGRVCRRNDQRGSTDGSFKRASKSDVVVHSARFYVAAAPYRMADGRGGDGRWIARDISRRQKLTVTTIVSE